MENDKQITISNIPVDLFLSLLNEMKGEGFEFFNIVAEKGNKQDSIWLTVGNPLKDNDEGDTTSSVDLNTLI